MNHMRMEFIRVKLGYSGKLVVNSDGSKGGLCLFWSDLVDISLLSFFRFHIDVQVQSHRNKFWRFMGFYGHSTAQQRHHGWTLLRRILSFSSLPWLCGGDFNEIIDAIEKSGGGSRPQSQLDNFRMALDDCGLQDLGALGPWFTWCNKRDDNGLVQERLDRFVCDFKWRNTFDAATVTNLEFWRSDHRPVILHVQQACSPNSLDVLNSQRRFYFEECWADSEDYANIIKDAWTDIGEGVQMQSLVSSISGCTLKLGQWTKLNTRGLTKEIRRKQEELLKASNSIQSGSWKQIRNLEKELDSLLETEEIYWKQRSRESWLKSGDRNSKYFHNQASSRKARNFITGLYDEMGVWKDSKNGIFIIVENYFSNIFKSQLPSRNDLSLVLDCVTPSLPEAKCNFLDSKFSADEVRRAVFDMAPTKAPGPDGLPALFYQKFWPVVGSAVSKACLGVLNEGTDIGAANRTLVTLIPKVRRAEKMTDFRPISLCNVLYKIVAKALANRLREVLGDVISETQSAFIPGRLISDNAIVGFKCMHALKRLKKRIRGALALKLDMSKAYDRIEWDFLNGMMSKLGFSDFWIDRIMRCVCSVSYSFIVNGEVRGDLNPLRGLRQGDLLSPYLFLICADGLSWLLYQEERNGDIAGFRCSKSGPKISHLFFADDSMLFTRASV
ncbi:hypothetical protein Dsin_028450 [Dipteronia sinensis]|uniref:Reverse transcriptase domain-containing protein n=1 Tax=Dipteronia sinensis TaxID=43782 RepID=A0AAE0DUL4_9ROSI|nr:hypothetical protein Dsin_028450 [Dipteronia sinensis]